MLPILQTASQCQQPRMRMQCRLYEASQASIRRACLCWQFISLQGTQSADLRVHAPAGWRPTLGLPSLAQPAGQDHAWGADSSGQRLTAIVNDVDVPCITKRGSCQCQAVLDVSVRFRAW